MHFSAQDVVLQAYTVQAEGILEGGSLVVGFSLAQPRSLVCEGKIPDRVAEGFSHDKKDN